MYCERRVTFVTRGSERVNKRVGFSSTVQPVPDSIDILVETEMFFDILGGEK